MFASLSVSARQPKFYLESRWVTVRWGLEEMFECLLRDLTNTHFCAVSCSSFRGSVFDLF